jgi:outer membrane protein TolC
MFALRSLRKKQLGAVRRVERRGTRVLFPLLAAGLAVLLAGGCSSKRYRAAADKDAYRIITRNQQAVLGQTNGFTIDTRFSARDPQEMKAREIIEEREAVAARTLTLEEALKLAIENSRTYQTRKERLYLSALALTGTRHNFALQPFASSTARASRRDPNIADGTLEGDAGLDKLLRTGGALSATLASDILRFYTGRGPGNLLSSLTVNLTQPLLRGAGAAVAAESLTQAERNVVYEVRSFAHFQRTFAVDIINTYYSIVRQKDAVKNNYDNYQRVRSSSERAAAQAQASRISISQAEQARQQELSARRSYISTVKGYQDTLDSFKITLGIPVSTQIALDDSVLAELRKTGITPIEMASGDAYRVAVENQLELLNEIDRFEDSQRRIKVAASGLKAGLTFDAGADFSATGNTDYTRFDFDRTRADASLQLDLPIDRLPERNTYRTALINFETQIRNLSLALDNLRNDVNEGLRAMSRFQRDYGIQQDELALANRRVAFETELFSAGRSEIRNLLEAQAAQINAQNAITQTLVNFHVARLQFLVDIGALDIDIARFWLHEKPVLAKLTLPAAPPRPESDELVVPEQLFKQP